MSMLTEEITLEVKGMTCGHCEEKVRSVLRALDGVRQVEASAEQGRVTLLVSRRRAPEQSAIEEAIQGAGFDIVR